MNEQYLKNVTFAKESINTWFSNLEQINNDVKMFFNENETDKYNTEFGNWYFGEGQLFSSFESFRAIEPQYNLVYDLFTNYNRVYKTPVKKSFFSQKNNNRKEELTRLFDQIKDQKDILNDYVSFFEENLKNSPLFNVQDQPIDILPEVDSSIEEISQDIMEDKIKQQPETNLKMEYNDLNDKAANVTKVTEKKPDSNIDFLDFDIEKEIHRILN